MRTVRVKNRPADEIEVTEAEYLDLVRQGLVEPQEPENDPNADAAEGEGDKPAPAPENAEGAPATRTRAPRATQGTE